MKITFWGTGRGGLMYPEILPFFYAAKNDFQFLTHYQSSGITGVITDLITLLWFIV